MHVHVQSLICATFAGRSIGMALALAHMRAAVSETTLDPLLIEPLAGQCERCLSDVTQYHAGEMRVLFPDVWAVIHLVIQVAQQETTFTLHPLRGAPAFVAQWQALYPSQLVVIRLQPIPRGSLLCHA